MQAYVDPIQRSAKMRAHTGTHLLHAALGKFFPHTKQAGSLVDEDYIRFDFAADKLLDDKELEEVATLVNQRIAGSMQVLSETKSYDDAIESGAKAFFEDKYGDEVRVVSIHDHIGKKISVELCGGTHVTNTGHIGAFMITEHGSVASGVKRIVAYTGPKVAEYAQHQIHRLHGIAALIQAKPAHIEQKIDKILKERDGSLSALETLNKSLIGAHLEHLEPAKTVDGFDLLLIKSSAPAANDFKSYANTAKEVFKDMQVAIYNEQGSFAIMGDGAKAFAQDKGFKGGGSDTFVQGRDMKIIDL